MDITALNRDVRASELPLERLATSKEVPHDAKIQEVSRQFEAVLLRQILSQAQKPMFKSSPMGGGGSTNAIYQDMVTQQLADRISQGGTFGFAKVLEQQLSVQIADKKQEATKAASAPEATPSTDAPPTKKFISCQIQPGKRV